MHSAQTASRRDQYRHFVVVPTRWMDNNVYGHVNNVIYYAYFDMAICHFLLEAGVDIIDGTILPFTIENGCRYHRPLSFPQALTAGLRVSRIGNSSVRYEIALFTDEVDAPAAEGYFIDVFVDRATRHSVIIPPRVSAALARLALADARR
jgi:acyl-CoA thioester hydrolase